MQCFRYDVSITWASHHVDAEAISRSSGQDFAVSFLTENFMLISLSSPITTYSGRGVAKPGLTPEAIRHHTIIHMIGTPAARKASELGMTKSPIAVDPSTPREKLDQMSRLNFGKIYTVEHNVKVKSVGTVTKESMPNFEAYIVNVLTGN